MSDAAAPAEPERPDRRRLPPPAGPPVSELSYFFPAHDEAENVGQLIEEALAALPELAQRFEIICVDDGSTDGTAAIAERLAGEHPGVVRVVRHDINRGYGAALRSGFRAARFELVAFTDGDRQFRVADIGRLLARMAEPEAPDRPGGARRASDAGGVAPDVVAGYRLRRADAALRLVYARLYRLALRIFFELRLRDVDCACKLFRRPALEGIRVESGGAFLSAELLIKLRESGRTLAEVGIPHHPRVAGRASGADPRVVARAIRDFWALRLRLWAHPRAALRRGEPVLTDGRAAPAEGASP